MGSYTNLPKAYSNLGLDARGLREAYQRLGFVIVGESVYENAYIADVGQAGQGGWTVGHLPHDPKGRLFYRGVFRATVMGDAIRFECRYELRLLLQDHEGALCSSAQIAEKYGEGSEAARTCPMTWCAYDRLAAEPVHHGAFFRIEDPYERRRALDEEKARVTAWLDQKHPDWTDPLAYWP